MKTVLDSHRKWEEQSHLQLAYAETHHVTIRAQLPESVLRQAAGALEKLAGYLEQATLTTVLCQTRPNTHELFIFTDSQGWAVYRSMRLRRGDPDERHRQYLALMPGAAPPLENLALFRLGRMFMAEATEGKAPAWLMEGFAAFCENAVTRRNLNYPASAGASAIKPGENWDAALRRLAGQNRLPQLEHLLAMSRGNMSPDDYATAYSLVGFLFKAQPRDFVRFVLEMRGGVATAQALERVYGRNIKEIQVLWNQWLLRAQ